MLDSKALTSSSLAAATALAFLFGTAPLLLLVGVACGLVDHPMEASFPPESGVWFSLARTTVVALAASTFQVATAVLLTRFTFNSIAAERILPFWAVAPLCVPPLAVALLWRVLLTSDGSLAAHLASLGIPYPPWLSTRPLFIDADFSHLNWAHVSALLVETWTWLPFLLAVLVVATRHIRTEFIDGAKIEGATQGQIYRRVILPLTARWIVWLWLLRFADSMRLFDIYWVFFKFQRDIRTLAIDLYTLTVQGYHFQEGAQGALASVAICALFLALVVRIDRRFSFTK